LAVVLTAAVVAFRNELNPLVVVFQNAVAACTEVVVLLDVVGAAACGLGFAYAFESRSTGCSHGSGRLQENSVFAAVVLQKSAASSANWSRCAAPDIGT